MLLLLVLFLAFAAANAKNVMKSVTLGELELHGAAAAGGSGGGIAKRNGVATACQAPGGIVNQNGDCVCCAGWSGPGCAVRNKCYDTSCSNGGYCDSATGFCVCGNSFTGPQCQYPSCSFNGIWDGALSRCVCNRGYGGVNCDQCASSPSPDISKYICIPTRSPLHVASGYMLMLLPNAFADDILSGTRKPDPHLPYPGILPGTLGHDGKPRACDCTRSYGATARSIASRAISNANLDLYTQLVVSCTQSSTLSLQQMQELEQMWYSAVSLEQQNLLNNTWFIVGIIFICLFILENMILIIWCFVKYYQREEQEILVAEGESPYGGGGSMKRGRRVPPQPKRNQRMF